MAPLQQRRDTSPSSSAVASRGRDDDGQVEVAVETAHQLGRLLRQVRAGEVAWWEDVHDQRRLQQQNNKITKV